MRKNKQLLLDENVVIESRDILVYKEGEKGNIYYFEGLNPTLNHFITNDYLEAVSALMKIQNIYNFQI